MRHYSHIPGAVLFYLVFAFIVGLKNPIMGVLLAAGISMFPDMVEKVTGEHRSLGHSLIWLVPLGLFALTSVMLAAALIIGFLSHLFLDVCTANGCCFLYPFKDKGFTCLPPKRRIVTGSNHDKAFSMVLVMLAVPLILATFSILPAIGSMEGLLANPLDEVYAPNDTTKSGDIQNDFNMYFDLDQGTNKNITIHKEENTTTILITDIKADNGDILPVE